MPQKVQDFVSLIHLTGTQSTLPQVYIDRIRSIRQTILFQKSVSQSLVNICLSEHISDKQPGFKTISDCVGLKKKYVRP